MKQIVNFETNNNTFYPLSKNTSESSEYGGNTLVNISQGRLWTTCYQQQLQYFRVLEDIKKDDVVLDVGSGHAELLTIMRSNYCSKNKYIGIEVMDRNINACKSKFKHPEKEILIKHDVSLGLPILDNSIDIVVCSLLLEHLDKEKSFFVLTELKRVCKPNGLIFIMMPIRKEGESNRQEKHIYEWFLEDIDSQIKINNLILLDMYYANATSKQIKNSEATAEVYKNLKGKVNSSILRVVLAPLAQDGIDIFLKLKKGSEEEPKNKKIILKKGIL